jgi:seryl-tRNA synthetase
MKHPMLLKRTPCKLYEGSHTCRRVRVEFSNAIGYEVLRHQSDIREMQNSLLQLERKFSKVQSRVLLCSEQLRAVRTESTEMRAMAAGTLAEHGTALVAVQEQANSLQQIISSLQDVVVKQVQVRSDGIPARCNAPRAVYAPVGVPQCVTK